MSQEYYTEKEKQRGAKPKNKQKKVLRFWPAMDKESPTQVVLGADREPNSWDRLTQGASCKSSSTGETLMVGGLRANGKERDAQEVDPIASGESRAVLEADWGVGGRDEVGQEAGYIASGRDGQEDGQETRSGDRQTLEASYMAIGSRGSLKA